MSAACWARLGRQQAHALFYGARVDALPGLDVVVELLLAAAVAEQSAAVSPAQALVLVTSQLNRLAAADGLSVATVRRLGSDLAALAVYLGEGHRLVDIGQATPVQVNDWVSAPSRKRGHATQPSVATRHVRRSAARMFFRVLRHLGVVTCDPTLDLALPPRTSTRTRPLEPDELMLLQLAAAGSLADTRSPAALALAEAGATHSELPRVTIACLDLAGHRVRLPGGKGVRPRWSPLSGWAVQQLTRRVQVLRADGAGDGQSLLCTDADPGSESAQSSCNIALADLLRQVGLAGEPGVAPGSIALSRPAAVLAATGSFDLAVRASGFTSADRLAARLGYDPHAADAAADAAVAAAVTGNRKVAPVGPASTSVPVAPAPGATASEQDTRPARRGRPAKPRRERAVKLSGSTAAGRTGGAA